MELTLKEIQKEEIKILDKVDEFLKKNGLKYSLFGGTLLGAVRHEGFIPWDDDIDLSMNRDEYDKMIDILKANDCFIEENIKAIGFELGNGIFPFIKFINTNFGVKEEDNLDQYLWIDIFPMDSYPDNYVRFEKKRACLMKLIRLKWAMNYNKKLLKKSFKSFCKKVIAVFLSEKKLIQKFVNLSKKYSNIETKFVNNNAWGYGEYEKFLRSDTLDYKDYKFGDRYYPAYEKCEGLLVAKYGDYMKLPPEEDRVTHNIKVFKINE